MSGNTITRPVLPFARPVGRLVARRRRRRREGTGLKTSSAAADEKQSTDREDNQYSHVHLEIMSSARLVRNDVRANV
jgi:hypothetical protein